MITDNEDIKQKCGGKSIGKGSIEGEILMLELPGQEGFLCLNYDEATAILDSFQHMKDMFTPTQINYMRKYVTYIQEIYSKKKDKKKIKPVNAPVYGPFRKREVKIKDEIDALNNEFMKILASQSYTVNTPNFTREYSGLKLKKVVDEMDGTIHNYDADGNLFKMQYDTLEEGDGERDQYYYRNRIVPNPSKRFTQLQHPASL